MKRIEKDELYDNLAQFLHQKGVQLTEGSYVQTLQKSCRMLADIINLGQQGLERAKTGIDTKLEQVRQVIHEKTAPKPGATPPVQPESAAPPPAPEPVAPATTASTADAAKPPGEPTPATPKAARKPRAKKAPHARGAKKPARRTK